MLRVSFYAQTGLLIVEISAFASVRSKSSRKPSEWRLRLERGLEKELKRHWTLYMEDMARSGCSSKVQPRSRLQDAKRSLQKILKCHHGTYWRFFLSIIRKRLYKCARRKPLVSKKKQKHDWSLTQRPGTTCFGQINLKLNYLDRHNKCVGGYVMLWGSASLQQDLASWPS